MFIREPSFNKPADRHAAKQPQVPEEVSLLILLILVTSHGIMSIYIHDPTVTHCTSFTIRSGSRVCETHYILDLVLGLMGQAIYGIFQPLSIWRGLTEHAQYALHTHTTVHSHTSSVQR